MTVMSTSIALGSAERPVRVAIVGSGPSGFFAAGFLLGHKDLVFEVDLFDRLPSPYGLLRNGVAPDHQQIKRIERVYRKTAAKFGFRFFGNVKIGDDIPVETLAKHYDQVVYAVGNESSRRLNIPGIDLQNSDSATAFVGWYNGHPDFVDRGYDLEHTTSVVVVGVGNVSMDVVRILAHDPDDLASTDIAEPALAVLRKSNVREIWVLGRRGPAQAAYTPHEIQELIKLPGADVVVRPEEVKLDPLSAAWLAENPDLNVSKNVEAVHKQAAVGEGSRPTKIRLRLLTSPVEVMGDEGRVAAVRIEKNELYLNDRGQLRPRGTGQHEQVDAQLVLRAVGYRGIPIEGLPFDTDLGIIPNQGGRVCQSASSDAILPHTYVVGWAKRGPTGLVGTNRGDAKDTVEKMIEDLQGRMVTDDPNKTTRAAAEMVARHQTAFVSFEDWAHLDQLEIERGQAMGKVRDKFIRVEDMLEALRNRGKQ